MPAIASNPGATDASPVRSRARVVLGVAVVGCVAAGLAAYAVPTGAGAASTSAHYTVVARYKAGATARDASHHTWLSDATVHNGGYVIAHRGKPAARLSALMRKTREQVGEYRVHVDRAATYRFALRYLTCTTSRCRAHTSYITETAKFARVITAVVPKAARRSGVGYVTVSRWVPATQAIVKATTASATPVKTPAPAASSSTSTTASAGNAASTSTSTTVASSTLSQPRDVVASSSVWRTDVSNAPLASNSAAMVSNLAAQVTKYYSAASFNVYSYNPTWYTVPAGQASTTVAFTDCQHKGYTPSGLFGAGGQFVDVPIPDSAVTSAGTDSTLTVYRPSTDQLWDFWKATHDSAGWHACWGGRIDHFSTSNGIFPSGFGASASGLASELGDVSIADAQAGSINHAITLAIPAAANWKTFSWPAQRSDGSDISAAAIPEGGRFRLDPTLDLSTLHLSAMAMMIAKAAQKYGFIVTDKSGSVAVTAESGVPTKQATGVNPWGAILNGKPSYSVMANFPWSQLQALPFNYGKS